MLTTPAGIETIIAEKERKSKRSLHPKDDEPLLRCGFSVARFQQSPDVPGLKEHIPIRDHDDRGHDDHDDGFHALRLGRHGDLFLHKVHKQMISPVNLNLRLLQITTQSSEHTLILAATTVSMKSMPSNGCVKEILI